jgi:hypothetical protein
MMAFLLHKPIEPAELQGLVLSAQDAVLQRFRWRPAPRLPDPGRRRDR